MILDNMIDDEYKSPKDPIEELGLGISTDIEALGINLERSLATVQKLLGALLVLGIVALAHFW
jgi:hypothetical protein